MTEKFEIDDDFCVTTEKLEIYDDFLVFVLKEIKIVRQNCSKNKS